MRKFLTLLVLLLGFAGISQAQLTMIPHYTTYKSLSWDQPTHTMTQTITVEGETTGNCIVPSCASSMHYPHITNTITIGATVYGGITNYTPVVWSQYLSETSTLSVPMFLNHPGTSNIEGNVICTAAGTIFSMSFLNVFIEPAYTMVKYVSTIDERTTGGVVPVYDINDIPWCTPQTSPPSMFWPILTGLFTLEPFYQIWGVCSRAASFPWECKGITFEGHLLQTTPLATCTKLP